MRIAQENPMQVEDLDALPEDGQRHELVRGMLLAEPRPKYRHGRVQARLARFLDAHAEAEGAGDVLTESGFILFRSPDTVRGPDVTFVTAERALPQDSDGFFEGAPDLAVEILSPDSRPGQVLAKVADYLSAGTRMVWVVDPAQQEVIV